MVSRKKQQPVVTLQVCHSSKRSSESKEGQTDPECHGSGFESFIRKTDIFLALVWSQLFMKYLLSSLLPKIYHFKCCSVWLKDKSLMRQSLEQLKKRFSEWEQLTDCKLSAKWHFMVQQNPRKFYLEFLSGRIQQELVPWKRALKKKKSKKKISVVSVSFPDIQWQFRPI